MKESFNTTNSLAHTKWNCKYHIVFAPKYRRKVFYEEHRIAIREILRKLCEWKGVEIIEFITLNVNKAINPMLYYSRVGLCEQFVVIRG